MRYRIELPEPAGEFHDGFPLGNGSLGAMLYGRPGVELLDLNADTLWSGGPLPAEPGLPPARLLPDLRLAVARGDHQRAEALARGLQGNAWTQSYQPLGRLEWRYAADPVPTGYRRWLDLAEAVAVTALGPVRLAGFVSAPDGVLVLSATGPGTVLAAPRLHAPHPGVAPREAGGVTVWAGRAPAHVLPNYVAEEPASGPSPARSRPAWASPSPSRSSATATRSA